MISVCWAVKGGSGTTVIAASMALTRRRPTLLVDLDGDMPAALGIAEPEGPGLVDWLHSEADPARLSDLLIDVGGHVVLLPRGRREAEPGGRWDQLAEWLRADGRHVVVDAGTTVRPNRSVMAVADERVLITRPCYLALRRTLELDLRPTGVVLVHEPGRRLKTDDVAATVGAPVVAVVLLDPKISHAVDAGLLVGRLPMGFRRELRWAS